MRPVPRISVQRNYADVCAKSVGASASAYRRFKDVSIGAIIIPELKLRKDYALFRGAGAAQTALYRPPMVL